MKKYLLVSICILMLLVITACNEGNAETSVSSTGDLAANSTESNTNKNAQYILLKKTSTTTEDNITVQTAYEYDEKGRLIKEYGFMNDSPFSVTTIIYDENGNKIEEKIVRNKRPTIWEKFEYTTDGLMLNCIDYDNDGNKIFWTSFEYDQNGKMLSEINYDANDILTDKHIYSYEEDDICTKTTYDKDGNIKKINKTTYDKNGNVLNIITSNAEDTIINEEYNIYDENGNLTLSSGKSYGNPSLKSVYEYNNDGKVIKCSHEDFYNNRKTSMKYEYDELGNLIKESKIDECGITTYTAEYEYSEFIPD